MTQFGDALVKTANGVTKTQLIMWGFAAVTLYSLWAARAALGFTPWGRAALPLVEEVILLEGKQLVRWQALRGLGEVAAAMGESRAVGMLQPLLKRFGLLPALRESSGGVLAKVLASDVLRAAGKQGLVGVGIDGVAGVVSGDGFRWDSALTMGASFAAGPVAGRPAARFMQGFMGRFAAVPAWAARVATGAVAGSVGMVGMGVGGAVMQSVLHGSLAWQAFAAAVDPHMLLAGAGLGALGGMRSVPEVRGGGQAGVSGEGRRWGWERGELSELSRREGMGAYREMRRLHPDTFPEGPVRERAGDLFARVNEVREAANSHGRNANAYHSGDVARLKDLRQQLTSLRDTAVVHDGSAPHPDAAVRAGADAGVRAGSADAGGGGRSPAVRGSGSGTGSALDRLSRGGAGPVVPRTPSGGSGVVAGSQAAGVAPAASPASSAGSVSSGAPAGSAGAGGGSATVGDQVDGGVVVPVEGSVSVVGEVAGRVGSDPNAGSGQTADQVLAELGRTSLDRLRVDAELGRAATGLPVGVDPMVGAPAAGRRSVGLDRVFADIGFGERPAVWVGEVEAFFPVSDLGLVLAEGISPGRLGYISGFTSLEQATRFGAGHVVVVRAPGFVREGVTGEPMALFVGGADGNFVAGWHEVSGEMSIYVEHSGFDPARGSVGAGSVGAPRLETPGPEVSRPGSAGAAKPGSAGGVEFPARVSVVPEVGSRPPTPEQVQRGRDVTGLTAEMDPRAGAADVSGVGLDRLLAGFGRSANPPRFVDDTAVGFVAVREGSPEAPFVNGLVSKSSGVVVVYDSPVAARAAEGGDCRVYVVQGRRGRFEQDLPNGGKAYLYVGGIAAHHFFGRFQSDVDTHLDVAGFEDFPAVETFVPNPGFDPDRSSRPVPAAVDAVDALGEWERVKQLPHPADQAWQRRQDREAAVVAAELLRPSESDVRRGLQAMGVGVGEDLAPAAVDGRGAVDPRTFPVSWANPDASGGLRWLGQRSGPVLYVPLTRGGEVLFESGIVADSGVVYGFSSLEKAREFGTDTVVEVDAPGGFIDDASGVVLLLDSVAGRYVVGKHVVSGQGPDAMSIFVHNPGFVAGRTPRKQPEPTP
ncbi:hypothetical protein AB0C34_31445, partial [Nocardia sp. NPDC049220]|uniref:hypothetical protein n=1 Tax=Nocardia sp. NPDC049220 TaxID=3155273 RepID=UPI0033F3B298